MQYNSKQSISYGFQSVWNLIFHYELFCQIIKRLPRKFWMKFIFFFVCFGHILVEGKKNVTVLFTLLVFKTKDQKKCLENIISV